MSAMLRTSTCSSLLTCPPSLVRDTAQCWTYRMLPQMAPYWLYRLVFWPAHLEHHFWPETYLGKMVPFGTLTQVFVILIIIILILRTLKTCQPWRGLVFHASLSAQNIYFFLCRHFPNEWWKRSGKKVNLIEWLDSLYTIWNWLFHRMNSHLYSNKEPLFVHSRLARPIKSTYSGICL